MKGKLAEVSIYVGMNSNNGEVNGIEKLIYNRIGSFTMQIKVKLRLKSGMDNHRKLKSFLSFVLK